MSNAPLRIETILIDAGETPLGTLTMATHKPRQVIKARVVRERDWRKLIAVVRAVDDADKLFPLAQDMPRRALTALRTHLAKR